MKEFVLKTWIKLCCFFIFTQLSFAVEPTVPLKIWINEAIINVYDFNDENWMARQKDIATYFTAEAWKVYLDALNKSNLLKQVQTNHFNVSAVATQPPSIKAIDDHNWEASMPILVQYKNKDDVQVQHLEINLHIVQTSQGGVRGFAILQFQSKIQAHPCSCENVYQPRVTIV